VNLQDWAYIAEIVGGIAVIVSLIYVGLQVNDSACAVRSAAASDATMAMQSWYLEMDRNRQASDIWFNAMVSPGPFSSNDEF
jgi:hypothetical protein